MNNLSELVKPTPALSKPESEEMPVVSPHITSSEFFGDITEAEKVNTFHQNVNELSKVYESEYDAVVKLVLKDIDEGDFLNAYYNQSKDFPLEYFPGIFSGTECNVRILQNRLNLVQNEAGENIPVVITIGIYSQQIPLLGDRLSRLESRTRSARKKEKLSEKVLQKDAGNIIIRVSPVEVDYKDGFERNGLLESGNVYVNPENSIAISMKNISSVKTLPSYSSYDYKYNNFLDIFYPKDKSENGGMTTDEGFPSDNFQNMLQIWELIKTSSKIKRN